MACIPSSALLDPLPAICLRARRRVIDCSAIFRRARACLHFNFGVSRAGGFCVFAACRVRFLIVALVAFYFEIDPNSKLDSAKFYCCQLRPSKEVGYGSGPVHSAKLKLLDQRLGHLPAAFLL